MKESVEYFGEVLLLDDSGTFNLNGIGFYFSDLLDWEIVEQISSGFRMSKPEVKSQSKSCPEPLYALMRQCWEEDPDERPTPNEIKVGKGRLK